MALQPGAMVVPGKVPVPPLWYSANQLQPPIQLQVDERDGFMAWLRGEFAAANAIIDALCHHLRVVGDPGEYEGVMGSIHRRRCNWNPVLYMQPYFSVAEVVYGLEQAGCRRRQKNLVVPEENGRFWGGKDHGRGGGKGCNSGGCVNGKDMSNVYAKNFSNLSERLEGGDKGKDDKKELNGKTEADSTAMAEATGPCLVNGSEIMREEKMNLQVSSRTFIATEIIEGKPVNIAEGLKLYEGLFDYSEISKLTNSVNALRAAGRSRQLKGQTYVALKRPMMGHGREIIQMGVPIADTIPIDETGTVTSKDVKTEPISEFLEEVIERLITKNVVNVKPDSTIIDFFNEGDYSQPNYWPQSFGKPVCVLLLTECEMSFSKVITIDHPGDYRGALQLSLSPGSILVMEGRSADFTRHAMPSMRKQRTLVTFVKSQPKKMNSVGNWAPPPSRSPKHFVPAGWPLRPHLAVVPGTGVFLPSKGSVEEDGVRKVNGGVEERNGSIEEEACEDKNFGAKDCDQKVRFVKGGEI